MHYDISFPHLGIHLEHVGKTISVFGFEIAYYGIIIGTAILLGFVIATSEAKRTGQDPESYLDMGMFGVVFGIIGARLYYVLFSWDMYKDNLLEILNIREGGLAIYGGVIAAVLTVIIAAKIKHLSAPQIFDTIALALLNGQMLGRWGNFFNREAFGGYTDSLFAMRLPIDAVRSSDVTEQMRAHIQMIDGVEYIQVHPTFLYESLWCCALLILLFAYRKHKKYEGELFLLYIRVWTWTRLDRRTPDRSASPAGNRTSCFPASGRCAGSDNRCFACVSEKKSFQIFDACKKKYRKIKFVK